MNLFLETLSPWYSNHTLSPTHKVEELENEIAIEVNLPGVSKDEIALTYKAEIRAINVYVENKINQNIFLHRQVDQEGITAKLDLGVLTIKAPIKNKDRTIKIE